MRPFLSVVLILALPYYEFAQTMPPGEVPTGTGVEIELLDNISSESLKAGQSVPFKLAHALEVKGSMLLPAGTQFSGTVTSANPSGHWGKAGAFDLKLDPLKLAGGALVRIDFHRSTRVNARGEKTGETIGSAVVMTYYFPLIPVALIAGSRKGKPFKIRSGERYLVYVTGTEASAVTESPKP